MAPPSRRWGAWHSAALVTAAAGVLLAWSWRTWPDPVVDFGRELYVPWQLTQGKVLYRDLAFHDGPLSPYLNAAGFLVFGVSLRSLLLLNAAILGASLWLVFELLRTISRERVAVAGCLTFLAMFAFGQYTPIGNYNWMTPYSHELTHAIALSLASLFCVARFLRQTRARWAVLSALSLGLLFLTKAEVFAAGASAVVLTCILTLWLESEQRARRGLWLGCAITLVSPALLAFLLLRTAMSSGEALAATAGSWMHVFGKQLGGQRYFLEHAGLLDPLASIERIAVFTAGFAVLGALLAALAFETRRRASPRFGRYLAVALVCIAFAACCLFVDWAQLAAPWPVFMLLLWLATGYRLLGARDDREQRARLIVRLGLTTFALLLLLKMVLNTRIAHYGFGLALPATLLCLACALEWIPAHIDARGGDGRVFASGATAAWVLVLAVHLVWSTLLFRSKQFELGSGANAFHTDRRGALMAQTLAQLGKRARPGDTLTCMPDCEMLNFLSGLSNPQRFGNFNPHQVATFGEAAMLRALERRPPRFIAVVHVDSSEYGPQFFGKDYASELWSGVRRRYRRLVRIGAEPMQRAEDYGVLLLGRNDSATSGD